MNFRILDATVVVAFVIIASSPALAQLPDDWDTDVCHGDFYDDGACDCGCGDFDDLDCPSLDAFDCDYYLCADGAYPAYFNNAICVAIGMDTDLPDGWSCSPFIFEDDLGCDCGCGAMDVDCEDLTSASCDFNECFDEEDTAADPYYPGYNDHTQCYAPGADPDLSGWICHPDWWRDGYCDCGCGVIDYDCDGEAVADCFDIHCDTDETVVNSNIGECVPSDTVETDPDTGTSVDTATEIDSDTDTGAHTDTGTGADSATVVDTDSATERNELETDTTEDTATVADSGTNNVDTAIRDSDTSSAQGDTGSTMEQSTETTGARDTDTTLGNDSASQADTESNVIITGRPARPNPGDNNTSGDNGSGSLFSCTLTPRAPVRSVLRLLF